MIKKFISSALILMLFISLNGFAQKNKKQTKVLISTSHGNISLVLYNETPKHRDNFIKLVENGYYNDLLFHRVIQHFMIQGGDPASRTAKKNQMLGNGDPEYTIPAEFNSNLIHKKGALAAARQPDSVNPDKSSSGSQFYIVQGKPFKKVELERIGKNKGINYSEDQIKTYETIGGYAPLDMEYTVFGELTEGMEVLDKIAAQKVSKLNRPIEDIKMTMKIVK